MASCQSSILSSADATAAFLSPDDVDDMTRQSPVRADPRGCQVTVCICSGKFHAKILRFDRRSRGDKAMKREKKAPRGNGVEASRTVDMIAPETLENLASKLKADLSKPTPDPSVTRKPAALKEKGMARKQAGTEKQSKEVANKPLKRKKGKSKPKAEGTNVANGHSTNGQSKSHASSKGVKVLEKKQSLPSQPSDRPRKSASMLEKKPAKSTEKTHKQEGLASLLDEILALGGTKEDLELVEDISSEDDLVIDGKLPKKGKGDEDSVPFFS